MRLSRIPAARLPLFDPSAADGRGVGHRREREWCRSAATAGSLDRRGGWHRHGGTHPATQQLRTAWAASRHRRLRPCPSPPIVLSNPGVISGPFSTAGDGTAPISVTRTQYSPGAAPTYVGVSSNPGSADVHRQRPRVPRMQAQDSRATHPGRRRWSAEAAPAPTVSPMPRSVASRRGHDQGRGRVSPSAVPVLAFG